jgi:uncharacterized protein YwgA
MARPPTHAIVDRFLLLYLLEALQERGTIYGRLQLHKLMFLVETATALEEGFAHPSFPFYRWDMGPWSAELQTEANELAKTGLLTELQPTSRAKRLVERWTKRLELDLAPAMRCIDETLASKGRWTGAQLKEFVYKMPAHSSTPGTSIRDTKKLADLVSPRAMDLKRVSLKEKDLVDLYLDMTVSDEEQAASDEVTDETTREVAKLLGWRATESGAVPK